jgi:hypothetical protein
MLKTNFKTVARFSVLPSKYSDTITLSINFSDVDFKLPENGRLHTARKDIRNYSFDHWEAKNELLVITVSTYEGKFTHNVTLGIKGGCDEFPTDFLKMDKAVKQAKKIARKVTKINDDIGYSDDIAQQLARHIVSAGAVELWEQDSNELTISNKNEFSGALAKILESALTK